MEILPFLLWPFMASLILTGIHAYLGVHVVERGVIFVDLSLAQIAALGASVAILYGADPHTGHILGGVDIGDEPKLVVAAAGALWVALTGPDELAQFEPSA